MMEPGTVVLVDAVGKATPVRGVFYAPELVADTDADGQCTPESDQGLIQQAEDAGWELLTGWSGQWGYHGPEMHPSEYIGGDLAAHILATPGYWVTVAVSYPDDNWAGEWCLAWREAPEAA